MKGSPQKAKGMLAHTLENFDRSGDPVEVLTNLILDLKELPERISEVANETIEVKVNGTGTCSYYQLELDFKGSRTHTFYGELKLTFQDESEGLNLDPIHSLGLLFWTALNRPERVPNWVLESLADRHGPIVKCSVCDEKFVTYSEFTEHELDAHTDLL